MEKYKIMKPIIKWSGGKSQEIKDFKEYFPQDIERYIEPFAGGAALYFYLEHNNSVINDINFELVSFYNILQNKIQNREIFIKELELINKQRDIFNLYFSDFSKENIKELFELGFSTKEERLKDIKLKKKIEIVFSKPKNIKDLLKIVQSSLKDKINRIKKIEEKNKINFNEEDLKNHLTTALQSALYFNSRNIYNKGFVNQGFNNSNEYISLEEYIANWYFVREFCYSSMFRFSSNGNFNVPYGGTGYNSKDFTSKIDILKNNKKLHLILENTSINNLDFEELFKKYEYFNEKDFLFLDPPYDSAFSQYNKEGDFDKEEQIRLRDSLFKVKCRFMVVIKETDFINEIYKDKFFNINIFDKKYLKNMRNRNDKDVKHLIITNY
jgi:DNA adenine methylase